ncbi:MAG: hypothetical protein ACE5ES_00175 [Candidatus Nanoarchaeia archaeon]
MKNRKHHKFLSCEFFVFLMYIRPHNRIKIQGVITSKGSNYFVVNNEHKFKVEKHYYKCMHKYMQVNQKIVIYKHKRKNTYRITYLQRLHKDNLNCRRCNTDCNKFSHEDLEPLEVALIFALMIVGAFVWLIQILLTV